MRLAHVVTVANVMWMVGVLQWIYAFVLVVDSGPSFVESAWMSSERMIVRQRVLNGVMSYFVQHSSWKLMYELCVLNADLIVPVELVDPDGFHDRTHDDGQRVRCVPYH